jgi:hypothetical protein
MHRMQPAAVAAALALSSSHAFAGIVSTFSVGAGASTSTIQVDFSNGNGYVVNLSWTEPMSGFQAMQAIAAGIAGAQLQYDVFPFGSFVTGIGLGADFEYGNGDLWPVENYWHYWTEVGGQWEMAMFGASDRMLTDGSRDAWVFGSSAVPQAVPGPGAGVLLMLAARTRRRRVRRRRAHTARG